MKPKRAGKRGICVHKFAMFRKWLTQDLTYECLAAVHPHLTPRMVQRDVQKVKAFITKHIGLTERHQILHWLHAHGIVWTCQDEKASYLDQDEKLRKVA